VITLRAPSLDDAGAVLEVLRERDIADTGEPDYTLQDLLDEWQLSEVDLDEDARVAEQDGRITGYGIVRRQGTMVAVDPRHESDDVGRALIAWSEERDRQRGREHHRHYVGAGDPHGRERLVRAGYTLLRSYWRMVRDLDGSERPGPAPDGIRMRALDVAADGEAIHRLDDVAFSAVPDYNPSTFEQFRDGHFAAHDLSAELSVVAEARSGGLAGFALTKVWSAEKVGFVDILAVHPDHQGRGLGSAILRCAFAGYAAAGLREAQLGVATDNPRALRLYEQVGMRQKFRFDVYERGASRGRRSSSRSDRPDRP
jgi:mycothiol synthase